MTLSQIQIGGEYYITGPTPGIDWTKWVSIIISGCTLILAYKIWKNYDIKKHFVKRQLDTVFELYNDITKAQIKIELKDDNYTDILFKNKKLTVKLSNIINMLGNMEMQRYLNTTPLYVDLFIISTDMPYMKYIENPFLPQPIVNQLRGLWGGFKYVNELPTTGKYVVISNADESLKPNWKPLYGKVDSETYDSFKNYVTQLLSVKKSVQIWLKQFGVQDMNLIDDGPIKMHGIGLYTPKEKNQK